MARVKPEERVLSYHDQGKCWRKFYKGKMHYLDPRGVVKSDDVAYRIALKNWHIKKAELDYIAAHNGAAGGNSILAAYKLTEAIKRLNPDSELANIFVDPAKYNLNYVAALNLKAVLSESESISPKEKQTTIEGLVSEYIAFKKSERQAGNITRQMEIEYEANAKFFLEWANESQRTSTNQIDEICLSEYRIFTLKLTDPNYAKLVEANHIAKLTVKKRLSRLKNLIDFGFENGHIQNLPRNYKSFAKFKAAKGIADKPDSELFWSVKECQDFYKNANQRTKLYILLGLNCGFTQIDIATLLHSHIDWVKGIISRKRNKTDAEQVHKLWPITLQLLKAELAPKKNGESLALLGQNDQKLVSDSEDTTTRFDYVRQSIKVLKKKLIRQKLKAGIPKLFKLAKRKTESMSETQLEQIQKEQNSREKRIRKAIDSELKAEKRSFKHFRKTASNMLEKEYGDTNIPEQFLAHSVKATKKFYVKQHHEKLFDALEWLRKQFDFESC